MSDDAKRDISSLSFVVIDDNEFTRIVVTKTLGALGATDVATAANGAEALAHMESAESPPDVLLVDLRLPGMSGLELLTRLWERGYGGAVILFSGADEKTLAAARELAKDRNVNVLGSLAKPVDKQSLADLLTQVR
ncbi:MAG: response regulator [Proteobacteria bacterium]|nr:response regulator [Pseudomonadota bacterium]